MTGFVMDCSVTMAWCFEDESDPFAGEILTALRSAEARVPSLWPLEVANCLAVAERRGRLREADSRRFADLLGQLPISVDLETAERALGPVLDLSRQHRLSSYDAAYLELAMRLGVPLATRDNSLARAARAGGVSLFQPAGS